MFWGNGVLLIVYMIIVILDLMIRQRGVQYSPFIKGYFYYNIFKILLFDIYLFGYRSYGQISPWCRLDVHWLGSALLAVLYDGQSAVFPPLLPSLNVRLHVIWLAVTYECPMIINT